MELRIIKNDDQYRLALAEVERLAQSDPDPETPVGGRLELLAKLVEDYEKTAFPIARPDPIDAIIFRMEQQGLKQRDIAELLGGKNRASEILARKRPLTLPMIRALHERLSIPSDLLIREPTEDLSANGEFTEADIPLDLLKHRGWIAAESSVTELLRRFLAPAGSPVLLKHTVVFGANARTNRTRIQLWLARVREIADARSYLSGRFDRAQLNEDLIGYVARLSWMDKGPRLAMDLLAERGIALVIEPHLPPTRLDGAAMIGRSGAPVIGMTLREDRLDNFWFTLIHELVHAWKHLDSVDHRAIADESIERKATDESAIEREANELAADILIPKGAWRRSDAFLNPSPATIRAFAERQQVNAAVVAGRLRFERKNYALFAKLVGYGQVRSHFPEIKWKAS
jgi:HTH-type transcriptional regulator / antitoxin HigA